MAVTLGSASSGGGYTTPTTINPQTGLPLNSLPDNALNEQAREFNVTTADQQALLAQLLPYLSTLSGLATSSGGGAAPSPGQVSAPTVSAPTLDNAFEPSAAQTQANAQAYGTAKSQTAAAYTSGLKSLSDAMASRGLGMNSGAAAEGMTDLYKSGEDSLANESTAEASTNATQGFTAGQSALDRQMTANTTNASNQLGAQEFNTSAGLQASSIANQRLSSILGAFGSLGSKLY